MKLKEAWWDEDARPLPVSVSGALQADIETCDSNREKLETLTRVVGDVLKLLNDKGVLSDEQILDLLPMPWVRADND